MRDQAESVRALAEKHGNMFEVQQDMGEGKVLCEIVIGEKLPKVIVPHRQKEGSHDATVLADLGLTKSDSSRWQAVGDGDDAPGWLRIDDRDHGKVMGCPN